MGRRSESIRLDSGGGDFVCRDAGRKGGAFFFEGRETAIKVLSDPPWPQPPSRPLQKHKRRRRPVHATRARASHTASPSIGMRGVVVGGCACPQWGPPDLTRCPPPGRPPPRPPNGRVRRAGRGLWETPWRAPKPLAWPPQSLTTPSSTSGTCAGESCSAARRVATESPCFDRAAAAPNPRHGTRAAGRGVGPIDRLTALTSQHTRKSHRNRHNGRGHGLGRQGCHGLRGHVLRLGWVSDRVCAPLLGSFGMGLGWVDRGHQRGPIQAAPKTPGHSGESLGAESVEWCPCQGPGRAI